MLSGLNNDIIVIRFWYGKPMAQNQDVLEYDFLENNKFRVSHCFNLIQAHLYLRR